LLALLYLLEHPERVERLALVSPASPTIAYRRQFEEEFARRMAAPEIQREREALRASGLRDPRRAFELSVAGYFRDFHDAKNLTPFRVNARTQQAVWDSLGEYDLRPRPSDPTSRVLSRASLYGTFDPIPIAGSRDVATLAPRRAHRAAVGHCPHVEATDDARAANEFATQ
jgi:pimeloyl-ACP methyl ester carboxylesterase